MKNELLKIIYDLPKNPVVWLCIFMAIVESALTFKLVNELSEALKKYGITIKKEDKKKWRNIAGIFFTIIFVMFIFFQLFAFLMI